MSEVSPIGSQTIDPNALKDLINHSGHTTAAKIKEAGVQFEAVLVRQFLGDALKPSIKGELEEDGAGEDTYRYFLNDMLSQNLARQGVFGIGKELSSQLTAREVAMGHITPEEAAASSTAPKTVNASTLNDLPQNTAIKSLSTTNGTPSADK